MKIKQFGLFKCKHYRIKTVVLGSILLVDMLSKKICNLPELTTLIFFEVHFGIDMRCPKQAYLRLSTGNL